MRAGMSVGANVEEAQSPPTEKDFKRRINIARGEVREVLYWLRLMEESGELPEARLKALMQEADEIVRILTAIVKKAERSATSSS